MDYDYYRLRKIVFFASIISGLKFEFPPLTFPLPNPRNIPTMSAVIPILRSSRGVNPLKGLKQAPLSTPDRRRP
jgi:hypothetical protein